MSLRFQDYRFLVSVALVGSGVYLTQLGIDNGGVAGIIIIPCVWSSIAAMIRALYGRRKG